MEETEKNETAYTKITLLLEPYGQAIHGREQQRDLLEAIIPDDEFDTELGVSSDLTGTIICGPKASGKSALLAELEDHVLDSGGRVILAKAEQIDDELISEAVQVAAKNTFACTCLEILNISALSTERFAQLADAVSNACSENNGSLLVVGEAESEDAFPPTLSELLRAYGIHFFNISLPSESDRGSFLREAVPQLDSKSLFYIIGKTDGFNYIQLTEVVFGLKLVIKRLMKKYGYDRSEETVGMISELNLEAVINSAVSGGKILEIVPPTSAEQNVTISSPELIEALTTLTDAVKSITSSSATSETIRTSAPVAAQNITVSFPDLAEILKSMPNVAKTIPPLSTTVEKKPIKPEKKVYKIGDKIPTLSFASGDIDTLMEYGESGTMHKHYYEDIRIEFENKVDISNV